VRAALARWAREAAAFARRARARALAFERRWLGVGFAAVAGGAIATVDGGAIAIVVGATRGVFDPGPGVVITASDDIGPGFVAGSFATNGTVTASAATVTTIPILMRSLLVMSLRPPVDPAIPRRLPPAMRSSRFA